MESNFQNNNSVNKQAQNLFKEKEDLSKLSSHNNFVCGDKNDCINEDIFKRKEDDKDLNYLDKNKSSIDLNLNEKNLHAFLNEDLIKALDSDLMDPEENNDLSDSNSTNALITTSSENNSNSNSPDTKTSNNSKDIISMNLNSENFSNKNNSNNIIENLSTNIDNVNNVNNNNENANIKNEDSLNDNIKDKIKILNDPLFAPIFIPKKINNSTKMKQKEEKTKEHSDKKKEKKNNFLKNKFDDDVEPIIMLSMTSEEKTKLPLEIRVGDWICLYCNNLNFSFRKKCNRCGLFRKSSTLLLKHQYFNNKYQNISLSSLFCYALCSDETKENPYDLDNGFINALKEISNKLPNDKLNLKSDITQLLKLYKQ